MNNATLSRIGTFLTLCATSGAAVSQSAERLAVPLSEPGRPSVLEISLFSGDIDVQAYDGNEIVVTTDVAMRNADEPEPPRADGLRRIQSSSVGLTIEENANTVSLRMDFSVQDAEIAVQVPRRTSVRASLVNGGISVAGVTGEHELASVNGGVTVTDVSGSAVLNSTNGRVRASFVEIDATKPMSFTSFNGDVDVSLPGGLAADLVVASQQGGVYTDFDVTAEEDTGGVERSADARGRYRVHMRRTTRYAIGGGGVNIQLRTFNGDIMIRRR